MSLETAVRGLLIADPALSALVGQRIYPVGGVPQGATIPYGVYQKADRERIVTHDGPVQTARYTLDLTFWSSTYSQAQDCATAAMDALLGISSTSGGVVILGGFSAGESDDSEVPQHAEEHGLIGASLSLDLWYRE